jgi:hypothetical protein
MIDACPVPLGPFERQLASWQAKIAVAARTGDGLDCYRAALSWAKNVPSENGLRELAKRQILEAAERHLSQTHGPDVLDAIYLSTFPEDATSNSDLDAEIIKRDKAAEVTAEIERLAKLSPIQYDRERKDAAEKLCIGPSRLLTEKFKLPGTKTTIQEAKVALWNYPTLIPGLTLLTAANC